MVMGHFARKGNASLLEPILTKRFMVQTYRQKVNWTLAA